MSLRATVALVTVFATAAGGGADAAAQQLDDALEILMDRRAHALAATIGKRALRRGRRAFALGPFITAGPGVTSEGDVDVFAGFGLGLVRYDIDIFISRERIVQMIKSRAKRLLLERFVTGTAPTEADVERLMLEVIDDVRAELMLELRPRRFERPKLKLSLEVDHVFDADLYDLRGTLGFGVSRVFVATGLVARINGGIDLVVPLELSVPMLLSGGLRAPAVEWFARYDIAATDRDAQADLVVVGARLMLDVI